MNTFVLIVPCLIMMPQNDASRLSVPTETKTIKSVLTKQVDAWNRGDIDEFMTTYLQSEKLSFSSGGKTTRGWKATRARYHKRYPNRAAMGRLSFDELEITPLGGKSAMVLGRWKLKRETGDEQKELGGNFTLVLRMIDGNWKIVHDHTSKSEP